MMVDVGAQPMRVRHAIVRARGDEQPFVLKPSRGVVGRGTRVMAIEGEAALETATDIGISVQPPAVRGEVIAVCQAVAPRESFQREIRKRSRRFADRKSRMAPSLEKKNIVSEARENSRRERTGEPATDDDDLVALAHQKSHSGQSTAGSCRPVTFIRRSRSMRVARQV